MCSISKDNINQDMPTISAVENYFNHQEGEIYYDVFLKRVLKVFENEVKKSKNYEETLRKRIDSILKLLVEVKTIDRKGNLIIKNT